MLKKEEELLNKLKVITDNIMQQFYDEKILETLISQLINIKKSTWLEIIKFDKDNYYIDCEYTTSLKLIRIPRKILNFEMNNNNNEIKEVSIILLDSYLEEYRNILLKNINDKKQIIKNLSEDIQNLNEGIIELKNDLNEINKFSDKNVMEKLLLKNKSFNKNSFCFELCSECTQEQIVFVKGITKCPNCGALIFPCSQCDIDKVECNKCPYEDYAKLGIVNRNITNDEIKLFKYIMKGNK